VFKRPHPSGFYFAGFLPLAEDPERR